MKKVIYDLEESVGMGQAIRARLWWLSAVDSYLKCRMGKEIPAKHLNGCRSLEVRQTRDWRGNSGDMRKARILLLKQKVVCVF